MPWTSHEPAAVETLVASSNWARHPWGWFDRSSTTRLVGRIHFHPKSISSTDTSIQTRFHPMTISSKTLSSNFDTFIQTQFHPMNIHPRTFSSNEFLIQ